MRFSTHDRAVLSWMSALVGVDVGSPLFRRGLTRIADAHEQTTCKAFRSLIRLRTVTLLEIRLLKSTFQPKRNGPWKDLRVGIPLPCEREGKLVAILGCQKIPARSNTLFNPRSPFDELFKDRLLPFNRNEVRLRRLSGELLEKALARPGIVVNAPVNPYFRKIRTLHLRITRLIAFNEAWSTCQRASGLVPSIPGSSSASRNCSNGHFSSACISRN